MDLKRHTVNFIYDGKASDESIDLAFAKNKADDRKVWITESNKVSFCYSLYEDSKIMFLNNM